MKCIEAADRRVQVSANRVTPRETSPDHYGLRRHLTERPEEVPKRRARSVASVARQEESNYDPADYTGA